MTENEIMTRDIHNFVRGHMNFEESLELIQQVSESEEWIDNLLFEIWLYETITSMKRKGISLNK